VEKICGQRSRDTHEHADVHIDTHMYCICMNTYKDTDTDTDTDIDMDMKMYDDIIKIFGESKPLCENDKGESKLSAVIYSAEIIFPCLV
jgi:hypothetical protein